ncbi:MAG TPA: hypothetical protein VIM55_05645 [Mucilaginibacter sp.]
MEQATNANKNFAVARYEAMTSGENKDQLKIYGIASHSIGGRIPHYA